MRPDFTKMTVDEIRELYCEKSGDSMSNAMLIKPKSALVDKLMEFYPKPQDIGLDIENSPFSLAEIESSKDKIVIPEGDEPERGSPEWQEYVLSLLRDDEYVLKDDKRYPKASGLRRLVEVLLGDIVSSGPSLIFPPNNTNGGSATVAYKIVISWRHGMGQMREFSDVADGGPNNTPQEYAVHASATASSRAAGRAFRNALLLSINTAEEMNNVPLTNGPTDDIRLLDPNEPSSAIQHVGIRTICSRLDINVDELLKHHGYGQLEGLLKSEAQNLLVQLSKYSSDSDGLDIPDSIRLKPVVEKK